MATTTRIGLLSGSIILKNIPISVAPSILAASRYAIGIPLKKFLNRRTLNALQPAISHNSTILPFRLMCSSGKSTNVIYNGTILIPGSSIDQKIRVSIIRLPVGLILDKTYPKIPLHKISNIRHPIIIYNIFIYASPKLALFHALTSRAGWYADGTWWETVGEWKVCENRFKNGMGKVFDYIRQKGMRPGIWLEPEVMGINCPILDKFTDDCFFMRHGKKVIDHGRYHFDFRNKKVTYFLNGVVDGLIPDYSWLWIDGFGNERTDINTPFAPEFNIQFTKPYKNYFNKPVFWKLNNPDTHLRAGLESIFFGQWFYALMVGIHGLNICSYKLKNKEYVSYFIRHMKMICSMYELSCYDCKLFGNTELYPRGAILDNLDSIGTIGMNLCDYYEMTNDSNALTVISALTDAALNNIPRFEDGTYYRIDTMWADDIYMSCPFLVRAARVLGRTECYDEVIRQINGFKKRLWIEDEKLLSHIYFPHTKLPNRVPWGRGNGWMALTLTEIIRFLPDSYAKEKEEIKAFFKEFCEGILNALDTEKYIFHQVLNRHESYEETSCSCMFIIAFIRGFKYGLLDKKYADAAKRVWQTVTETSIDDLGNVYNVCMGSGCSMENEYYFNIPTKINDDHGTGIVLLAGSEILSL